MHDINKEIVTTLTRSVIVFSRILVTVYEFPEIECILMDIKEALSLISKKHATDKSYYGNMYEIPFGLPTKMPTLLQKVKIEIKSLLQLVNSSSFKNNHEFIHLVCSVLGHIRKAILCICTKGEAKSLGFLT